MWRHCHAEITAFKTTGYKNSTVLGEGKSGFPMERRPGTATARLLATKPLDPAASAYLRLRPAYTSENIRLMAVRSNTFNTLPSSYITSPTATQVLCSQRGKSRTATTKTWKGSQLAGLSQFSMCTKHMFFYPDMSLPALRMPRQQGCRQGSHPGRLYYSSWMLYPTIWNHTWMGQWCLGVCM